MIRKMVSLSLGLFFFLFGLLATGCGAKDIYPTFAATGIVKLDGVPLAGAQVWLLPKSQEHLKAPILVRPQGIADGDGKFVLTTYYKDDGAPGGEFDIIVLMGDADPDGETTQPKTKGRKKGRGSAVPHKYTDAKNSGLSATIKSSSNEIILELKSK